jgi:hypothetical protein
MLKGALVPAEPVSHSISRAGALLLTNSNIMPQPRLPEDGLNILAVGGPATTRPLRASRSRQPKTAQATPLIGHAVHAVAP